MQGFLCDNGWASPLELPRGFRESELRRWLARIPSARSRTMAESRLESFLGQAQREHPSRAST